MSLRHLSSGFVLCLALAGCKSGNAEKSNFAAKTDSSSDGIPHAMLPDNIAPTAYRIDMIIDPDESGFSGLVEIDVDIKTPSDKIWIHAKEMDVNGATAKLADGSEVKLDFTAVSLEEAPSGIAYLAAETPLPKGAATLSLPYETPFNLNLNSAYKVERGEDAYIITQFEALGAREAFPSFDEPRFKVPFDISITAPEDNFVYANTPEITQNSDGSGWIRYEFAQTKPLPTYLIAFGVGPFDVVEFKDIPATDVRDRPIPLRGIAARGEGTRFNYALENTAGILEAIENYFGIPYPYEKLDLIAAPDYAFGAMENPGAIVYLEYLLLMDENAPLSQKRAYARVHSHELAHQWFGNLVTPFWWEDIWLNEAFATWMGNKGTALWQPDGNFDRSTLKSSLGAMNLDSLSNTRAVREPLERSENVQQQFDSITYRKGGGTLDMFESYLGEENFQKGVRLHMKRFEHEVATADDFFQSLADGSGNDEVVPAMKSFVDQPGLPLINVGYECEAGKKTKIYMPLSQSRYAPLGSNISQGQTWQIPVCISTYWENSKAQKSCILLKEKNQAKGDTNTLMVSGALDGTCPLAIMPNADGAGYYRFTMAADQWSALLANFDKLNTREALATQDSLLAAYRAGEVDSSVYLRGVEAFANHPEYDVVSKAGDLLGWMENHVPERARADYERFVRDIYRERFDQIIGTDTLEGQLLSPTLLSRLINQGDAADLRAEFAAKAHAYLSGGNKSSLPSNLTGQAFAAAILEDEEIAFEPLLDLAANGSPLEKGNALSALTYVKSPDLASRLLDIAVDDDGPLTGRQSTSIVNGLLSNPDHSEQSWRWFKDNFEHYVTNRIPDVRLSSVPAYASGFCSVEARDEAKRFFTDNADLIPGYERRLAQTIESIELCTALKTEMAEEMADALIAR
ncbi:MAG: M1 family metallopeptidase [Hellea sp.]|nr:M1 family metallopeptidase [Hellea sp.]